jgi:hypothetical protein
MAVPKTRTAIIRPPSVKPQRQLSERQYDQEHMHHAPGQGSFAEFSTRSGSEGFRAGTENAPRAVHENVNAQRETKYEVSELAVEHAQCPRCSHRLISGLNSLKMLIPASTKMVSDPAMNIADPV